MAISKVNESNLRYEGEQYEFLSPDNRIIAVRELNGEDEDVVSRVGNGQDGTAVHKIVSRVVTSCQGITGPIRESDVASWGVRTIYYTLMKARIHSLGKTVTFPHLFKDEVNPIGFTEDLSVYDWDFGSGKPPKPGEEGYDPRIIQPYPMGETHITGITSSGKNYRMRYMTGFDELMTLGQDSNNMSLNDMLRFRAFEVQSQSGQWIPIQNFAPFSLRDMREFRAAVDKDPAFDLRCELRHPSKPIVEVVSLFSVPDFFFPKA